VAAPRVFRAGNRSEAVSEFGESSPSGDCLLGIVGGKLECIRCRHGPGDQIALKFVATSVTQEPGLLDGFDSFGNDLQPERMPETDHAMRYGRSALHGGDLVDEAAIDLQAIDGQAPQEKFRLEYPVPKSSMDGTSLLTVELEHQPVARLVAHFHCRRTVRAAMGHCRHPGGSFHGRAGEMPA
jgi:hypothetical protein